MNTSLNTTACRHCRHYTPEGRRGGTCQQLSAPVQSNWKACSLAVSPFDPSWEKIEEIALWEEQTATLPEPAITALERNACQLTGTTLTERERSVPTVSV